MDYMDDKMILEIAMKFASYDPPRYGQIELRNNDQILAFAKAIEQEVIKTYLMGSNQ